MQKLKEIRKEKGLSQEELAKISGISRVCISNLETGTAKEATIGTLKKLAAALDVPIIYLLP